MKTYHFETNLKCSACEDKVRKNLEKEPLVKDIAIDLKDPRKTLTVKAEEPIAEEELKLLIKEAGFEAHAV
ncbi:MAG: heavy-metal-associated domain-containing protein [Sphingobacteriales bacterium]|nr:MAG: heavy-metal-associated domain-containing protein [Sphingobacteriales bacterium]